MPAPIAAGVPWQQTSDTEALCTVFPAVEILMDGSSQPNCELRMSNRLWVPVSSLRASMLGLRGLGLRSKWTPYNPKCP